ncbi:hypothetical protein [Oerskovia flava]|uniref:hypothetical protein n=1 Tax=Oerskovia flava TaxID=2986422 RepID=UPI00223FA62F|nr:hypothetical protein [Oerskovia sp. JB1-3-2]
MATNVSADSTLLKASSSTSKLAPKRVSKAASKRDSVTFRPTTEERRILDRLSEEGVTTSDAVRRGLHLLAQERWLDRARADAAAHRDENLNDEPDAW